MAVDMFLKLTDIPGESQDSKHREEIEVLSFNIGANNLPAARAGSGKPEFHDFSFVMLADKATAKLFDSVATGKAIASGVLTLRSGGEKPVEFIKYTFSEVFVTALSQGGSEGEDRPTQEVSLAYSKIRLDYVEISKLGDAGGKHFFEFDLKSNKV
jgi:type VI secretion system secreted protein Hcp